MKVLESNEKQQINLFIDKLTSNKDINKSNNKSEISDFNLEYQKYKVPPNNHMKLKEEFNKLLKFVQESNLYRDIYGNKITKKGKLLLTPYQRLKKLNAEIKAYLENKCNKKPSPLIIKNYSSKNKNQYINFNSNTERKKIFQKKKYNIIKRRNSKMNKFKEKHYLTMNKLNLEINPDKESKSIIKKKVKTETTNSKKNFLYVSNTSNISRNKFFNTGIFNQINFWRTKIIKTSSLYKKNNFDKDLSKISKTDNFFCLTSREHISIKSKKNKNNENINSMRKTINIRKINRNRMLMESKTMDDKLDKYKYKLIQFNIHQLIKPSLKYKDKIVLNTKEDLTKIKKNNDKKEENLIEPKNEKNKISGLNMFP